MCVYALNTNSHQRWSIFGPQIREVITDSVFVQLNFRETMEQLGGTKMFSYNMYIFEIIDVKMLRRPTQVAVPCYNFDF
jgi:hypothetical protein